MFVVLLFLLVATPICLVIKKMFTRKTKKGEIKINKKAKDLFDQVSKTMFWSGVLRP